MNKHIYMVRHCEAVGQPPDSQLTEKGFKQALQLADFLNQFGIDRIIASPFLRAVQSIGPFAKRVNLEVEIDERLSERVLSSKSLPDWMNKLEATFRNMELTYEGGESSQEAMNRIQKVVDEITTSDFNSNVFVTHGNIMSLLLNSYDKNFGFEKWKSLSNPDVFLLQMPSTNFQIKHLWKA